MLDELLKHDKFGNKKELGFVLFQALSPGHELRVSELTLFCTSNMYSLGRSIKGIISLLNFLSIISLKEEMVYLNQKTFNPNNYKSSSAYFQDTHFFKCLFKKLYDSGTLEHLFNEDNLKFSHTQNQFYIKSHLIKLNLYSIRNLLIALNFLEQDQTILDHLFINSIFTNFFKKTIVENLKERSGIKKITLKQLKKRIDQKEKAGKQGELFALKHEQFRLKSHPQISKVELISETYVNAGYDIQSYNDMDSFIHNRFIEVKSYENEATFYWSKNEVEKAKQLKDKYYLYLVNRSLMSYKDYIPKIIQNPYKKIFENDLWKKESENWKIILED